jgi:hypothetical protein
MAEKKITVLFTGHTLLLRAWIGIATIVPELGQCWLIDGAPMWTVKWRWRGVLHVLFIPRFHG